MNLEDFILNKESTAEKIHKELFKTTTEYQYFNFGLACGLQSMYEMASNFKNHSFTGEEILQIITLAVEGLDKDATGYFNKLTS